MKNEVTQIISPATGKYVCDVNCVWQPDGSLVVAYDNFAEDFEPHTVRFTAAELDEFGHGEGCIPTTEIIECA